MATQSRDVWITPSVSLNNCNILEACAHNFGRALDKILNQREEVKGSSTVPVSLYHAGTLKYSPLAPGP